MPKSKSKPDNRGLPAKCQHCGITSYWFVITAASHTFCDECWSHYEWDYLATKVAITKDGGLNSSKPKAVKPKGNRSLGQWEESLAQTSKSKQDWEDW